MEIATNTSGQGAAAVLPAEISGWNWGAMLLNWIWGIGNKTWIALLMFVPVVNLVMFFVLGAKGNEWAWRNKKWDSVEHFRAVQRKWALSSVAVIAGIGVLIAVAVFAAAQAMKSSVPYLQAAAAVSTDAAVAQAIGTPVEVGGPSGSISSSGGAGKAEFSFDAKGPKGKGTVSMEATESGGQWTIDKLELALESGARFPVASTPRVGKAADAPTAPTAPAPTAAGAATQVGAMVVTDAQDGTETEDAFDTTTEKIYCKVKLANVGAGTKLSSAWVAVDVKDVTPNKVVSTMEYVTKEDTTEFTFSVAKPQGGWPLGMYRIDSLINGKKVGSANFKVE